MPLNEWRLRCPRGELDLLFPNTLGRPMDQFNFSGYVFYPALRRARLRRVRVHDLRHACASMLIATGADIASVSRHFGHKTVAITLSVYKPLISAPTGERTRPMAGEVGRGRARLFFGWPRHCREQSERGSY